jgi:hypothetical protein
MMINPVFSCHRYPEDLQDRLRQGNEDFQRLAKALNSGDLAGAQRAFEALQQDMQSIQRMKYVRQTTATHSDPPIIDGTQAAANHDRGVGNYIDVII